MPFLIGTDEAGYGPNLGPLTITGTLWENGGFEPDLYRALEDVVKQKAGRADDRLFVADSKQVYKSGSIKALETGVLSLATWLSGRTPTSLQELCAIVCPTTDWACIEAFQWYDFRELSLPLAADTNKIHEFTQRLTAAAELAQVRLLNIECVPVFPNDFNARVSRLGNKATLLSHQTMLIASRLKELADDDIEIICDKHGGRSKYAGILQQVLTKEFIHVGAETKAESDYAFREHDRDVIIRFRAGGEDYLPTAVASMVSKYIRELFMHAWNHFWAQHVRDLKPTKGYPVDARRFKDQIQAAQWELNIEDVDIWRNK